MANVWVNNEIDVEGQVQKHDNNSGFEIEIQEG
jgi:hypothetical protein